MIREIGRWIPRRMGYNERKWGEESLTVSATLARFNSYGLENRQKSLEA